MRIVIGSTNITKVDAVKNVLEPLGHQVIGINVSSGVSAQPFSDKETVQGAKNRAYAALAEGGDFGIGLEAGVEYLNEELYLVNWGVLVTTQGESFTAGGTRIPLPMIIKEVLESGVELSDAIDAYAHKQDIRSKEGAIGILTENFYNRKENFIHIIKLLWGQYLANKSSAHNH